MSDLDEPDASGVLQPEADPAPSDAAPPEGEADGEAGSGAEAEAKAAAEPEPEPAQELDAGQEPEPPPERSPEELLAAERDQYLSDLQRVTAEFANFRKQTDKRNAETVRQAAARVMQAILPVLDACDAAALQQVEGVEPIAAQLRGVLEAQGLEVIDQTEAFDPNRHEAAMSEPGDEDQDEPMVSEVLRTGYAFNGRVLRAAMVRVKG
ncbi:MAG: nucleotide exchange factor GrpE [Acidimicrobiaceae bacterium]|nr:nucleotide exchange factor GrpE [Acidimicrobiaceae bacterium]